MSTIKTDYAVRRIGPFTEGFGLGIEPGGRLVLHNSEPEAIFLRVQVRRPWRGPAEGQPLYSLRSPYNGTFAGSNPARPMDGVCHIGLARKFSTVAEAVCYSLGLAERDPRCLDLVVFRHAPGSAYSDRIGTIRELDRPGD